ncbi:hypothetical protein UY3_17682 [Chelonia mydas]|uniref:Uncharacterized protein n=1 Tax=Chelonia mydas TaxID=8469 RepID=M7BAJ8_CHEMY|nr:hypothetical protein UY3_17682 [Chelonia mydas]
MSQKASAEEIKLQFEHEQRLAEIRLQKLEAKAKVERLKLQLKKIKEQQELYHPGKPVSLNSKDGHRICPASNITLVKADLVKKEDYLPNQRVNVVVLCEFTVSVPLARIHLEWNGTKHEVIASVRKLLPKDILIGEDIKALFSRTTGTVSSWKASFSQQQRWAQNLSSFQHHSC